VVARILSVLLSIVICALHVTPAWSAAPSPRDDLRAHIDQLLRVVEDRAVVAEPRAIQAREVVGSVFDFASAAPRAFGPHWRRLSASQRREASEALRGFLTEAVVARLTQAPRHFADRMRHGIAYGREIISGDHATIHLTLLRKYEDVAVEADMVRRGKSWRVEDLSFDGVSLVDNYRAQFDRLMRQRTYDEVIQRLQTKREMLTVAARGPRQAQ
jgi:phospholipid transport system substrate-binding protein